MNDHIDLFGAPILDLTAAERHGCVPKGYPRRPGSGPAGQTCGTCVYAIDIDYHGRCYYKCAIIKHRWTHGPGTDIKLKSPACELWQPEKT